MEVAALQRQIKATDLPLEKLAGSTVIAEKDKMAEVSRAFEAILLRQILQDAQKPLLGAQSTGNSASDSIYRDLVVNQLADSISKSGQFGLARAYSKQLEQQSSPREATQAKEPSSPTVSSAASPVCKGAGAHLISSHE
jgi:Rod binding domain-containing protein